MASAALADGGAGGASGFVAGGGGVGGTTNLTSAGGAGGDAPASSGKGGGGGGAGTTGGTGGAGAIAAGPETTAGGAGGASAGANGANGQDSFATFLGGGGGGGGAHGAVVTTTTTNSGAVTGGTGGAGGYGLKGGGGGGGAGGYGVVVNGSGLTYTSSGTVTGGTGGAGGANIFGGFAGVAGGNGGDGGVGIALTGSGTLINSGSITGGNGGAGGAAASGNNGTAGAGGAGIVGAGLTVINSGTIAGGAFGDGMARADAITFTGGTNVLELQAGSTITGNVVAFSAADTLRLGGASNASFDVAQIGAAAQYRGFGVFAKTGSSIWTLTGTNAAALSWAIDAGTLMVNGIMSSASMTVNSGGTLGGTGTVGSVTVASGGTFAPGSGTPGSSMTVTGNLAFQSGSAYLVQVNPSTASSAVTGSATLTGGTVNAVFASGSYLAKQYTILTASGGFGGTTFAGLANGNLPAGFTDSLGYSGTSVFLNLTAILGATGGLNDNQQSVASALNSFFNSGGALPPSFVSIFGLTGGNLSTALAQLSGEAATGGQRGAFQFMGQFFGLMLDPFIDGRGGAPGSGGALGFAPERAALPEDVVLAYARAMKVPVYQAAPAAFEPRWTAWASGFGGYNRTNGDPASGSTDLTARAAGVAAGLDYRVSRDAIVGFSLAGGGTNWDLAQGLGSGKSDTFAGGVYGAIRSGPAYVAASFGGGNHRMSTDRFALGDHLTASFNGESFGGRIEGGYRFATPITGITPYAALQAQSFCTPTYSETDLTGGGFGLTYTGRTATDTRSELGARFDQVALVNPDAVLIVRGRLAWAHDWVSNPTLAAAFQALPGTSFLVNGATPAKDTALVSAGAELKLAKGISLLGKFDGEFAGKAQTYAGTGTLRVSW